MAQETTAHVAERVACNEYRESGIEWIGKIPRHWHVMRARFCMVVNPVFRGLRDLQPDDEVSFVPMEAVGRGRLDLERTRTVAARRVGYTEFQDGDVMVAKITPCFENGKGAVTRELLNGVGIGTTELHVLRAGPGLDHRFLFYFTISQPFRSMGEGEMYGAGGQKRVPVEFCKDIRIPQPPSVNEQRAIADFLDQKTTKIDVLTERKSLGLPGVRDRFRQWPRGEWSGRPGKLRPDDAAPCTQFVVLAGRVLPYGRAASGVFRQRIRTRPSARPCRSLRCAAGSRGRDIGPPGGGLLAGVVVGAAAAAGQASRWRRAGRGLPGARLPRVSVRGRRPRGPGRKADAWFPRWPSVRQAAAGRGLRARPVRGRRASW